VERKKIGFRSKYKRNQDPSQYGVACRRGLVKAELLRHPRRLGRPLFFFFFSLFFSFLTDSRLCPKMEEEKRTAEIDVGQVG
jgi:hypothetical protein